MGSVLGDSPASTAQVRGNHLCMRKTTQTTPPRRVLIAAGGTGGHLFPALAVAAALARSAGSVELRFAGGAAGLEHKLVPAAGYPLHTIAVRGWYRVGWRRKLWVVAMAPWAFMQCFALLLWFRPHLVLGVGGYASGPVLATALLLRRVVVLLEPNAFPGITNRLLGRWVRCAFVPTEEGAGGCFPRRRITGTPVRAEIFNVRTHLRASSPVRLFVFGGSQGAQAINQAMIDALPHLREHRAKWSILHQTGSAAWEAVREAYAAQGWRTDVRPFITDIALAYRDCHLVLSRAGAVTVAELAAAGRAAVLVPIPSSSGDHQRRNAQRMARAGAAVLLEQAGLNGRTLAETLCALLQAPQRLGAMERAAKGLAAENPAQRIAEHCLALMR